MTANRKGVRSSEPKTVSAPMKNGHRRFTCIDLFAGCGGLSLGLELAGFQTLLFSELNESAAETYLSNRVDCDVVQVGDIKKLTNTSLDGMKTKWATQGMHDIDLVCGGPPCQGYSGIGHRRSYKVEREEIPSNHLYKQMIRVINAVKPKAFLFENVKGLMVGRWTEDGTKGEIWREVRAAFGSIKNYEVGHVLVQAKDYGVPQNRPRVLILGLRKDLGIPLPTELHPLFFSKTQKAVTPPSIRELLSDLVDDEYLSKEETAEYLVDPQTEIQEKLRKSPRGRVLRQGDRLTEQQYTSHSPQIRKKFEYMLAHGGEIPSEMQTKKFAQRVLLPEWGPEGPNITATSLPDDFVHYCQPRILTVREWARLQTFPDWYVFKGPRTTGGHRRAGVPTEGIWDREVPRYTQIGNAVPVRLAHQIGKHLVEFLK